MNLVFIGPISPPVTGPGVKNKYILEALKEHKNVTLITQNTLGWNQRPISFLYETIKNVVEHRRILISVSKKGRIVFSILIYFLSLFVKIKYVVFPAGGSLDEEIKALPFLLKQLFIQALNKSDMILVESTSLQTRLENMNFNNIYFFPNPRKNDNFKWIEKNREKKHIIFLSKIRKGKGVLLLLEAVSKLKDYNLALEYYGPIEEAFKEEFEERIAQYDFAIYKRIAQPDEVQKIISNADIFVFPTLFDEGLPGVLVEASFTGVPMITSRFKACEEYIKDDFNGLIVEQNNQEELIDAMKKLLNSRQLQKNLSSNFLQSSHQFNIDVLIKKLLTNLTNKGWDI
ncbi:MAG TPA: glycosyltransferase family 1 protein [Flavobacteriia bacterium]|nr:glycosyltransferase family 1 protein [Flavobacteriia bacterium]